MSETNNKPMLPSASGVKLAMMCPKSVYLPREEVKSESAEKGTAVHDFLDRVSQGIDVQVALESVPEEHRPDCLAVEIDDIPKLAELRTEVAIAWNPWTRKSRILGHHLGRDYAGANRQEEFVGTADRIGRMVGGEYDGWFTVDDYKTGSARLVDHVEKNWQTLTLAVAFAAEFNLDRVLVGIVKTQGQVRPYYFPLERFDLAMGEQALIELATIIRDDTGKHNEGRHCKWCPSFIYCEKKLELAMTLVRQPNLSLEYIADQIKADPLTAYNRWRVVKDVVHKMDDIIKAHARENPIPLSDGQVYGPVEVKLNVIDPGVAFTELTELHGQEVARKAFKLETSKAGVERAIAAIAPRGSKASMVREALGKIQEKNGFKEQKRIEIREHKPGEEVVDAEQ